MHLPDGIITFNQAIIYYLLTIIILIIYNYLFSKNDNKEKQIVQIALFATITFLLSSLSFPSPMGIPIHFFVIPLAVIMIGLISGTFVSFISLLAQTLFLGMGGILSFGANFIVMGFVISLVTYVFYNTFSDINEKIAVFLSTIMGIMFATFTQIIILVISGSITFETILSILTPYYMFIAIIEGILNVMIIYAISSIKPEIMELNKI